MKSQSCKNKKTHRTVENFNPQNMVEIRQLKFYRGAKIVYSNLSLNIPRCKITAIMGPSGTGKTTLLRLIGGQLRPLAGDVVVDGISVPSLRSKELYSLRRRMGVLFQAGALFTDLNVFENVAFTLRAHTNLPEEMIHDMVTMKLEAVGLRGAADLAISELSGGMARRVALARAVVMDPDLMMYDEPFTGQDPITRGVLIKLIRQINDVLGLTSIVVTHDVKEAFSIADYLCVFSEGKVIGQGTPEEITHHRSPAVQQFIQGLPDGTVPFHYPSPTTYQEDLEL